jgi:signal transduction histidine kinase
MLYNIIYNAIKNTPANGKVSIDSSWDGSKFRIRIADNGSGMTAEQVNNLFSRFRTRLDINSKNSGIGLAIANSIAEFHGIIISVSSEPGKGSEFFLTFPENS